jgi:predicted amidohydrolase
MWFPETFRILSRQDADLVCIPTNWVWPTQVDENGRLMANYVAMVQAHMNGVFVVAADRIGTERGQKFLGGSLIVGPSGSFLAGPAGQDTEELLLSDEVNLSAARRSRAWNDLSHLLNDRRTDLYDDLLGYQMHSKKE